MTEFVLLGIPTVIYLLVHRRRNRPAARAVMGLRRGAPGDYLVALGLGIVVAIVFLAAMAFVPDELIHAQGTTGRITGFLPAVAVILRAAGEEIFFRGFVMGLLRRLPFVWANLVQGVLFLLPHLLLLIVDARLWPILPMQFAAGLLMGWLRHRSGSVGPPTLVHAVLNLGSGLM